MARLPGRSASFGDACHDFQTICRNFEMIMSGCKDVKDGDETTLLSGGADPRGCGAILDYREVTGNRRHANVKGIRFAGLPILGGMGLEKCVVELRMVRH